MPEERSWDIDSEMDWDVVELLMKRKQMNGNA
jgi:CMP-N-acetylneuraminic acid synthetase